MKLNSEVSLTKVVYALLIVIAVIAIVYSTDLPPARASADIGPAVYPVSLAVLIILFAIADSFVSSRIQKKVPASELLQALGTGAVMLVAIWLSSVFGLFVVLPIAAFVTLRIAGSRRLMVNAAYSMVFTALLWGFFDKLLGIPLHQF